MTDNVPITAGSGTTIATDDVTDLGVANGAQVQRVKAGYGSDNNYADPSGGTGTDDAGTARVTLATNVPLPAGTNAIGKLSANSGVDIGDVDVTSVIPGAASSNLGKAIDNAAGASDVGVAMLAKHKEDQTHLTTADGDYDIPTLDSLGSLHVNAEAHHIFDELDSTTGWTVLGNDTANLATTKKHVMGTDALTFDKVNGAANTVFAGIQKTLTTTDLGAVSPHDILQGSFYIPDLTDVDYLFLRLGTDSSNYNEWRIDSQNVTAGIFETGALTIGDADYNGITGNGMDATAITYIAVGAAFNTETDTLAGLIFDQLSYHTNQHTSTSINSEVTSSVSSANVNISKVGNKTVNTQAGNVATGTQRITIATDDVNLAAIKTAVEIIDNAISGNEMQVDIVTSALPTGAATSANQTTANSSLSAIETSVGLLDNAVSGNELQVDVIAALPAGTNNIGDVDIASAIPAGTNLIGDVGLSGARTSGGTTPYRNIDVDQTEDQVKASAGQIYWIHAINLGSTVRYLKIYNATAASVSVGSTTPDMTFPIPTQGDSNGAGFFISVPNGIEMNTAITIAATTNLTSSGAPGANEVIVNMGYA